jgi:uncharacterized membrane protein
MTAKSPSLILDGRHSRPVDVTRHNSVVPGSVPFVLLASSALSPLSVAVIVVLVVAAMFVSQWVRRRRANQAADELGGTVVTGPLPTLGTAPPRASASIGTPNPALSPASAPDQRTGIMTSGPPVELSICGLPALVWQRGEHNADDYQGMRLSLIADTAAGLPVLNVYHRGALGGHAVESGIAELDDAYRFAGDLSAWAPVLSDPAVQTGLRQFPLDSLSVLGGRITLVSRQGVHLDPGATTAIAHLAAAFVEAVPPQLARSAPDQPG